MTQANVELDLTDQTQALDCFQVERIGEAYLAAAKAGGIGADNTHPAEFINTKLMLKPNVVH